MNAALGLYRLQQVDSQIDQIRARLKAIRETLENDLELRAATDALSAAEERHRHASQALKESEAEAEKQSSKIEQTEASLYGGSVHNPKELQDLQLDVVSLKKYLGTLEERELEAMMQAEEVENELRAARAKLESIQSDLKAQNLDLTVESEALNKDLETLKTERDAVISDLNGQVLKTYEGLRQHKRGLAVAVISDDACSACGTTLTAAQQQGARNAPQLYYCPTCGRILYSG